MTVTVSDKDGNYVTLPVTVSYGVLTFTCLDQPEFKCPDLVKICCYWTQKRTLQKKVNAAMAFILLLIRRYLCVTTG